MEKPNLIALLTIALLSSCGPSRSSGQLASILVQTEPQQYTPSSTMPVYRDLTGAKAVVVHLRVKAPAGAVFHADNDPTNQGGVPISIRPYLHQEDNLPTERWWAVGPGAFYVLAAGDVTLTVPLTPDRWVDVGGQPGTLHPAEFAAALANLHYIGLTMGGRGSYGHGINVSGGPAELDILSYNIVP